MCANYRSLSRGWVAFCRNIDSTVRDPSQSQSLAPNTLVFSEIKALAGLACEMPPLGAFESKAPIKNNRLSAAENFYVDRQTRITSPLHIRSDGHTDFGDGRH